MARATGFMQFFLSKTRLCRLYKLESFPLFNYLILCNMHKNMLPDDVFLIDFDGKCCILNDRCGYCGKKQIRIIFYMEEKLRRRSLQCCWP